DSLATIDNGSCTYDTTGVQGCTDPSALNFDFLATIDNGSCTYDTTGVQGCTDSFALNFDSLATLGDSSCVYLILTNDINGCTNETADNYNNVATVDNGSCIYLQSVIPGCTSPLALNYNLSATENNGTCVFADPSNIISRSIPEGTQLTDTVGTTPEMDCTFDYTLPVDSTTISDVVNGVSEITTTWEVWQNGSSTSYVKTYTVSGNGNVLLYLSIVCNSFTKSIIETVDGMTFSDVVDVAESVFVGVDEPASNNAQVSVYPVPTNDVLNVNIGNTEGVIGVTVVSLTGVTVSSSSLNTSDNSTYQVDVSGLPAGVYILRLSDRNGWQHNSNFIKQD
ncbi:MAG: T9SS type A sorting domain-containing protein, partial [Flavobacteriales bacterium]|nr:T9SS type A sorting domain-containing protein [Flavobacteriales bacterium]